MLFNAKSTFKKIINSIYNNSVYHEYIVCQKHFYFKLFSLFKQLTIQSSLITVSMSKTVQFQIIQFSISTQFKFKYSLIVKNISILSYSV